MTLQISGYQIVRKINQGGMSTVYLAIQISVGRVVALKVMNPSLNKDPAFSERFQREANIVGQLSHSNIVSIYDIGQDGDLNYIAMDYLPNGSVHEKMIDGMTGKEALRVVKEIASALSHAHEKGYIHRDIKPENILFRADNSAVLSDFGVAKIVSGVSRMTKVGTVVGTPHYMSPEQTRGKQVDARSDIYSLGIVFYEMLTGKLPYQADEAITVALKHISAPIPKLPLQYQMYQKILEKFLAKDPEQRFQSGREVCEAIEQLESSKKAAFVTTSAPEDQSIVALAQALILATLTTAKWRFGKLLALRWSKAKGFYQKQYPQNQDKVKNARLLYLPTRITQTDRIHQALSSRSKKIFLLLGGIALAIGLWCGFSLFMYAQITQGSQRWPAPFVTLIHTTALLFITPKSQAPLETQEPPILNEKLTTANELHPQDKNELSGEANTITTASPSSTDVLNTTVIASQAAQQVQAQAAHQSSVSLASYRLKIQITPATAQIRFLNTAKKYNDNMQIPVGRYRIELRQEGYKTKTEWIDVKDKDINLAYELDPLPSEKKNEQLKTAPIKVGDNTPTLIQIPAGNFVMGYDNNSLAAPAHKVTIKKPFAISKYEVTFAEYDIFIKSENLPQPGDNSWGRDNRPVIHVSWNDANAYTQWLSKTTGKKFRLPTEAEWEYAARGGTTSLFWWGDQELEAKGKANCRRGCYSSFSGLFGSKTAPVGSYPANNFGLHDTAGNVAEWVQDCFHEGYKNTPADGRALEETECASRVVRGGSTKDNVDKLGSHARGSLPPSSLSETLGFRVVMDIN